jgi:hypothetical protein
MSCTAGLSLLWVASLSSDRDDDDDEELAPQSPLACSKIIVSGSVRGTADDEEALAQPCSGLSTVVDTLGDEKG